MRTYSDRLFPLVCIIATALPLTACSRQADELPAAQTQPAAASTTPVTGGDSATITAEPNPVPTSSGKGSTTVTWSFDKGTVGEVYLWTKSQGEKQFAGASPRGSQNADWIAAGGVYEFRLYEGKEHKRQLASVRVTGEASK